MTLPVTLIGGYLGAGKTTLVNHLLRTADGLRLAILVNEFGALPIDADLIEARGEKVIAIAGGCVCCSYGSDLMAALMDLEVVAEEIDHVLIETSGVALPDQVARSLDLLAGYAHDGTVVLADAETVRARASDDYLSDTIAAQLESGDLLLLNKGDLVANADLAATRAWLAHVAPDARLVETAWAQVDKTALLGAGLDRPPTLRHHHTVAHTALELTLDHAVDVDRLARTLSAAELGLVRAKGVVRDGVGGWHTLQVVGRRRRVGPTVAGPGRLVCIAIGEVIDEAAVRRAISNTAL